MEIGIIIVVLILAIHIWKLRRITNLKNQSIEEMWEEEHAMDEVLEEDYNGKDLYIKEEEREIWNSLTRKQKRWVMKEQERKIKSGQYVRTPDGIITRAEAKEKGLI